jgi:uncharacterized membrane protein YkvA (DUF1232 family)
MDNRSDTDSAEQLRARSGQFSVRGFWQKLRGQAGRAGHSVVRHALQLYYAAQRPDTPAWARRTAYGALAYFILPTDLVPDFIVAAGYTDDLGALALAVSTLATYIDDDVRQQADERLGDWFPTTVDEHSTRA